MWKPLVVLCIALLLVHTQTLNDPDKLLNFCLDAKNHKTKPGPEDHLHDQCSPWKGKSCCTLNTTKDIHLEKMYNFNYNHCSQKKNMSEDCLRHFKQDLCFFECSPNIGPWTVKVNMKHRKERFYKVPLCASDCKSWFNACINDYTCTDNWMRNWDWKPEGNKCLNHTECKTFKDVFGSADNFCQKVWDDSWEYTTDDKSCMRLWFEGSTHNPNDNVVKYKIEEIKRASNTGNKNKLNINLLTRTLLLGCHFYFNIMKPV